MAARSLRTNPSMVSVTAKMQKTPQVKLATVSSIAWKPETVQSIYRDWGIYYSHKQKLKTAALYYGKALELKDNDERALYRQSQCKREKAQPESAMKDTAKAMRYNKHSSPIDLEFCDAIYETNEFESCKVNLLNKSKKYHGSKVDAFQNRLDVVDEVFKDCVGDSFDEFLRTNERHLTHIMQDVNLQRNPDKRPLYKILQEQKKCDVMSVLEKEEKFLSPLEIARRQRTFKVFNQVYFNTSWLDVLFLKDLRMNRNLLLPQSFHSTPILRQTTHTKYEVLKKFLKMLHCRSPMYNVLAKTFPNKKVREKYHDAYLDRVQYQTRRNMHAILRNVRLMRDMGEVEKLSKYVEDVMGDYVALKTHRVMPWKYEFVHEVYNILALAHADHFIVPEHFSKRKDDERLSVLLGLRRASRPQQTVKSFVFGDRSTYQELDALDQSTSIYKKLIARFEKRLRFAKYGIERSYILHEIARTYLSQNHFDECVASARKAVEESRRAGSNLWEFLSMMVMFKSFSALKKLEYSRELLNQAKLVVQRLRNPKIGAFLDMCSSINDADISMRKRQQNSNISIATRSTRRTIYSTQSKQSSSDPSVIHSRLHYRGSMQSTTRASMHSAPRSQQSFSLSRITPSNSIFMEQAIY